jgi:hypothetical protein
MTRISLSEEPEVDSSTQSLPRAALDHLERMMNLGPSFKIGNL